MAPLIFWGLPSTTRDDLLFGGDAAWNAERYNVDATLDHLRERAGGADTDLNPLTDRTRIIDLTESESERAEILRRYRLFSRQPDEMIIFRALQRMNPRTRDFDPKLYQYGGGYVYLIGATLGAASLLQLVHVSADAGLYLEQPEQFAAFYVVARFISLVFGALTLVAISKLARRAGGRLAGWLAMLCVACSPVFITAVLEAKPHLPSACLILWAVLSGLDYRARHRWADALRMGLQAGYAFGLVLTGIVAAFLWPVLVIARSTDTKRRAWRHLAAAGVIAAAVYLLTNPYVPYNYIANRDSLDSNIGNSTAMYENQIARWPEGALRVAVLLVESVGVVVPVIGLIGLVLLARRHPAPTALVAASGLAMMLICVLLGAGKPAEFARFLILPVLLLNVATAWMLATLLRRHLAVGIVLTLAALGAMRTPAYIRSFAHDAYDTTESRRLAGQFLRENMHPDDALAVLQEPAPYAVPPVDFTRRRVLLLPPGEPQGLNVDELPEWLVFTADNDQVHAGAWWSPYYSLEEWFPPATTTPSQIAWADKPVFVCRRPR